MKSVKPRDTTKGKKLHSIRPRRKQTWRPGYYFHPEILSIVTTKIWIDWPLLVVYNTFLILLSMSWLLRKRRKCCQSLSESASKCNSWYKPHIIIHLKITSINKCRCGKPPKFLVHDKQWIPRIGAARKNQVQASCIFCMRVYFFQFRPQMDIFDIQETFTQMAKVRLSGIGW